MNSRASGYSRIEDVWIPGHGGIAHEHYGHDGYSLENYRTHSSGSVLLDHAPEIQQTSRRDSRIGLGVPQTKPFLNTLDLVALSLSLAALASAVAVVDTELSLAWKLGLKNQFVVIGVLLNVMNQCFRRIAPVVLAIFESRFGRSTLQNYDAIMRNTALMDHTSIGWRTIIIFFTALPAGLGAAYKQFIGATTFSSVSSMDGRWYGQIGPGGMNQIGDGGGIALVVNATIPFMSAAAMEPEPPFFDLPRAYGFNHLFLSNHSAAMLDIPMPTNLSLLQNQLRTEESWRISAHVNATVVRYNDVIDQNRWNETWWGLYPGDGDGVMKVDCWNGYAVGLLMNEYGPKNESWIILGYLNYNDFSDMTWNRTALFFNAYREKCHGTWDITKTSITLISGNCTGEKLEDQSIYTNATMIMYSFFLDLIKEYMSSYAPSAPSGDSLWRTPVWTSTATGMYWARVMGKNGTGVKPNFVEDEVFLYRPVMRHNWLLYTVLAIQPAFTVFFFICGMLFYSSPIGKGFGMLSILAGANRESLNVVNGASFSGKTDKPVGMRIGISGRARSDSAPSAARVEYSLMSKAERRKNDGIRRHEKYS